MTSVLEDDAVGAAPENAGLPEPLEVDITKHPSGIIPTLQYVNCLRPEFSVFIFSIRNIVSTVNLGCQLDLKRIALHARNAEYNPKVIFSSG